MVNESHFFKIVLGSEWEKVPPSIRARFDAPLSIDHPIFYVGKIDTGCSRMGKILGKLLFFTGALAPYRMRDVPVQTTLYVLSDGRSLGKMRLYHFKDRKPYVFHSLMKMSAKGELLEYVGGGMGMRVALRVLEDGSVEFSNDGCFVELWGRKLYLPLWLTPGKIRLIHYDCAEDAAAFGVSIDITHPWLGRMYWQDGLFHAR